MSGVKGQGLKVKAGQSSQGCEEVEVRGMDVQRREAEVRVKSFLRHIYLPAHLPTLVHENFIIIKIDKRAQICSTHLFHFTYWLYLILFPTLFSFINSIYALIEKRIFLADICWFICFQSPYFSQTCIFFPITYSFNFLYNSIFHDIQSNQLINKPFMHARISQSQH